MFKLKFTLLIGSIIVMYLLLLEAVSKELQYLIAFIFLIDVITNSISLSLMIIKQSMLNTLEKK